ncbi:putative RNA uridine N3 methyltransferase [Geoglobus sp.]
MDIAIPSSSLINERDEKLKVYKIGMIARAAAIFRIRRIYIYHDPLLDEADMIREVLEYLETPQYLRKYLFPIKRSLRFAGVLPPLRIPSHKPKDLKIGEVREGVIVRVAPDGTAWADVGAKALALYRGNAKERARVTVRVCSKNPLVVEDAQPDGYWGYRVRKARLKDLVKRKDAVIASRRGNVPHLRDVAKKGLLIFGSPAEGVHEIAERLGVSLKGVDVWNMFPDQGTQTVRLEEAVMGSLAITNYLRYVEGGMR